LISFNGIYYFLLFPDFSSAPEAAGACDLEEGIILSA